MDDWRRWHSVRSGVYHSDIRCRTGNNIEEVYLAPGRGGRRQCQECRRLGEGLADDMPDLTGVTFDRTLPDGTVRKFLWGVATAGQQVEGGIENNEWASYTSTPFQQIRVGELADYGGTQMRLQPAGDALNHWQREAFEADLDRAQALGLNTYRFSVEWSRVEPTAPNWVTAWIAARSDRSTLDIAFDPPGTVGPASFDSAALDRYAEMVAAIRARGMEPIVTLNHMTLPDWALLTPSTAFGDDPSAYDERTAAGSTLPFTVIMRGSVEDARFRGTLRGWETRATGAAFRQYVHAVVTTLTDVRWWLTFNEPVATMIDSSYLAGAWPPGFIGYGRAVLRVYYNLIQAHVDAYDEIHTISAEARVGCSHWLAAARRAPQTIAQKLFIGDNEAAKNQWVFFHNHYFLDAVLRGDDIFGVFGGNDLPDIYRRGSVNHRSEWAGRLDFVAVQYYRSVFVYHEPATVFVCPSVGGRFRLDIKRDSGADDYLKERLYSDLGWTIEPQGLREVLNDMHERYQLPILISENGIGEAQDRNRAPFILSHLQQVLAAIKDGVDILGYVHWTIADNWEWTFGYLPQARFGLFTVDRDGAGRPRHITTGAIALAAVVASSNVIGVQAGTDLLASPIQQFGNIDPYGTRHIRQIRQLGALWDLSLDGGEELELLLVPLLQQGWLGMAYQPAADRWTRLTGINWESTGRGPGRLTFTLPVDGGQPLQFTASTLSPSTVAAPHLTGAVTDGRGSRPWHGVRRAIAGVYRGRGDPQAPTHLSVLQLQSSGPWRIAAVTRSQAWMICENVEVDAAQAIVRCVLPDGRQFSGIVSGRRMTATLDGVAPWNGTALQDDIPFA